MAKDVFVRIDQLMKTQKKKKKDLNDYLGLTHSTYDNWKNGSSESFLKHIDKIAEFLNVTPNYLLRGTDTVSLRETKQKMNEDRLVKLYRSLPEDEGERLLRIVEAFVSSIECTTGRKQVVLD